MLFNTTFYSFIDKALKAEPADDASDSSQGDSPQVDLMAGLEEVQVQSRPRRRTGYNSVRCKDKISSVSVPVGPTSDEMREVRVYAESCLLYTSPSPRDKRQSRMPSSA